MCKSTSDLLLVLSEKTISNYTETRFQRDILKEKLLFKYVSNQVIHLHVCFVASKTSHLDSPESSNIDWNVMWHMLICEFFL